MPSSVETKKQDELTVYDPAVIAALEDVMRILARLAQHDDTFKVIQQHMLDAAQRENMPISVIAPAPLVTGTTAGVTSSISPASSPVQNVDPTPQSTPEASISPEEHLALLKELKQKLDALDEQLIPQSVCDVLKQLYAQVDQSIQVVTANIASTKPEAIDKATQQDMKKQVASTRTAEKTAGGQPGLFEKTPKPQTQKEEEQPPTRARSQSFCIC